MGQQGGAFFAEFIEEHVQRCVVAARAGPHQTPGVVIDHDNQVAVTALVAEIFIDPDPAQPIETIDPRLDVVVDPGDDHADRAPRHPQQLTRRGLRGAQPSTTPPCHRSHGSDQHRVAPTEPPPPSDADAATGPAHVGLDEHLRRARVQRPPPAPTITSVIARRPPPTSPTTTPGLSLFGRTDTTIAPSPVYRRRTPSTTVRASRHTPSPDTLDVFSTPSAVLSVSKPSTARNLGIRDGVRPQIAHQLAHGHSRRATKCPLP